MDEKKEIEWFISNDKLWIFTGKYKDDMPVYAPAPESRLKLNEKQKKFFSEIFNYLLTLDELANEEYTVKDLKEQNFPLSNHNASKFKFFIFKEFNYDVE